MATTVGSFSAIDDTEVDAESPITETLVTRLRDNSYWIDAGTRQTTQTSTTKVLTPDGSGGVQWVEANTIAGVDGTKGAGTMGTTSGAAISVSIISNRILNFESTVQQSRIIIDSSDDSFVFLNTSSTLTGSFVALAASTLYGRKNGANYEFYDTSGVHYNYVWL